jgi:hypothetical protein
MPARWGTFANLDMEVNMVLELNTPREVTVMPAADWKGSTGRGMAIFVETQPDLDRLWTVVFDASGQVWEVPNYLIRFTPNFTWGRNAVV